MNHISLSSKARFGTAEWVRHTRILQGLSAWCWHIQSYLKLLCWDGGNLYHRPIIYVPTCAYLVSRALVSLLGCLYLASYTAFNSKQGALFFHMYLTLFLWFASGSKHNLIWIMSLSGLGSLIWFTMQYSWFSLLLQLSYGLCRAPAPMHVNQPMITRWMRFLPHSPQQAPRWVMLQWYAYCFWYFDILVGV